MPNDRANRLYRFTYVLILTIAMSAAFLFLIRDFLIDILLAATFAGLLHTLFEKAIPVFGGRRTVAATTIVVATILVVALPLAAIITIVGSEAIQMSKATVAWLQQTVTHPEASIALLPKWLVENQAVRSSISSLTANIGGIINGLAGFLTRWVSSTALGAVGFFLDLFVTAFAVVYFLQDGPSIARRVMERIPVANAEARVIVDKTLQITAATLKSIVIIGAAQGILVGIGFAVAGLGQPWFWGTIAAVAANVPAFGSGLVWVPGAIYLALTGHVMAGVGLALWGVAVVSIADNLLRMYIVGRGASMPGFLVFISTLGGLAVLGPSGLLIGPVLAGTLLGVFDLYHSVLSSSGLLSGAE